MDEKKCCGDHAQHICALAEQRQLEQIKDLTRNPQYICANCGRAADKEENLCNPVSIDQIGFDAI